MVKGLIVWKRVWTEIAGDTVTGSYAVRDGIVTVQIARSEQINSTRWLYCD